MRNQTWTFEHVTAVLGAAGSLGRPRDSGLHIGCAMQGWNHIAGTVMLILSSVGAYVRACENQAQVVEHILGQHG